MAHSKKGMEVQDPNDVSSILFQQRSSANATAAAATDQSTTTTTTVKPYISSKLSLTTETATGCIVQHGRGLVAASDIRAGELLFVTSPILTCNVVNVKQQFWKEKSSIIAAQKVVENNDNNNEDTFLLENLAEQDLLDSMKQAIQNKDAAIVNSFLALTGRVDTTSTATNAALDLSVARLLGKDNETLPIHLDTITVDNDLLQIIRKNAFGPDFVTYQAIVKCWRQDLQDNNNDNSPKNNKLMLPHRILGLYPLAAMINHSCHPNAVRVYCREVMLVHANQDIATGSEIVWSYLPPTQSFPVRQAILQRQHGFVCSCTRCQIERPFFERSNNNKMNELVQLQQQSCSSRAEIPIEVYAAAVESMEDDILLQPDLTNELRRYLRVGFMDIYIHYLNTTSTTTATTALQRSHLLRPQHDDESLLQLCTQLHFSFCSCDNASTEHLSVRRNFCVED